MPQNTRYTWNYHTTSQFNHLNASSHLHVEDAGLKLSHKHTARSVHTYNRLHYHSKLLFTFVWGGVKKIILESWFLWATQSCITIWALENSNVPHKAKVAANRELSWSDLFSVVILLSFIFHYYSTHSIFVWTVIGHMIGPNKTHNLSYTSVVLTEWIKHYAYCLYHEYHNLVAGYQCNKWLRNCHFLPFICVFFTVDKPST